MKLVRMRKWMTLAAVLTGSMMQITNCRNEAGLFVVRSAFSSVFLPLNQLIVFFFDIFAQSLPTPTNLPVLFGLL